MDLTGATDTSSRFQHYELLRRSDGTPWELGRGTMGVTYKAFDVNLRCEVALKVVNPALIHHPNARERFIREARAAARPAPPQHRERLPPGATTASGSSTRWSSSTAKRSTPSCAARGRSRPTRRCACSCRSPARWRRRRARE